MSETSNYHCDMIAKIIEKLAEMTQQQFQAMDKRIDGMVTKDMFQEGMDIVLGEIRGVRQDVRSFHMDVVGLEERIVVLEEKTGGRQRMNV